MDKQQKPRDSEPLSLHGMTPEEAIQKMFAAGPGKPVDCPHCGGQFTVNLVDEQGEVRCPKCGGFLKHASE